MGSNLYSLQIVQLLVKNKDLTPVNPVFFITVKNKDLILPGKKF